MDHRRIYFQTTQADQTDVCSHCKTSLPQLTSAERAKHRFCSCCGAAVARRTKWQPRITIDESGSIVSGPANTIVEKPFLSVSDCLSYLDAHPGQVVVVGGATIVLGGGLVLVAAPLAAVAAAVVAGGVTILQTSLVGGVLTAVCAACSKDAPVGTLLKGVGIVALSGITTIAAGGVLGFIASLCGLLGGVLMLVGELRSPLCSLAKSTFTTKHDKNESRIRKTLKRRWNP